MQRKKWGWGGREREREQGRKREMMWRERETGRRVRDTKELVHGTGETVESDICGLDLEIQTRMEVAVWSLLFARHASMPEAQAGVLCYNLEAKVFLVQETLFWALKTFSLLN